MANSLCHESRPILIEKADHGGERQGLLSAPSMCASSYKVSTVWSIKEPHAPLVL
jgi:hypothetical protein